MSLRRSNRLSIKLNPYYEAKYIAIEPVFREKLNFIQKKMTFTDLIFFKSRAAFLTRVMSPTEMTINITNIIQYMTTLIRFIMTYEKKYTKTSQYEKFCDMLYTKSFIWIKETNTAGVAEPYSSKLQTAVFKFRHIYEEIRYEDWKFLRIRYKLDDIIMFTIGSYIHKYIQPRTYLSNHY